MRVPSFSTIKKATVKRLLVPDAGDGSPAKEEHPFYRRTPSPLILKRGKVQHSATVGLLNLLKCPVSHSMTSGYNIVFPLKKKPSERL